MYARTAKPTGSRQHATDMVASSPQRPPQKQKSPFANDRAELVRNHHSCGRRLECSPRYPYRHACAVQSIVIVQLGWVVRMMPSSPNPGTEGSCMHHSAPTRRSRGHLTSCVARRARTIATMSQIPQRRTLPIRCVSRLRRTHAASASTSSIGVAQNSTIRIPRNGPRDSLNRRLSATAGVAVIAG